MGSTWERNIYAIDSAGTLKWMFPTTTLASSLVLSPYGTLHRHVGFHDNNVFNYNLYFRDDTGLYALDPTGTLKWKFNVDVFDADISFLLVDPDNTLYFYGRESYYGDSYIFAVDVTGSLKWKFFATCTSDSGTYHLFPAIGPDGTLYIWVSESSDYPFADNIYAIDATGNLKWKFPISPERAQVAPLLGPDGTLRVVTDNNTVYNIDTADGLMKWKFSQGFPDSHYAALSPDGTLYIGSLDNNIYAIDATGSLKWKFRTNGWVEVIPVLGPDGTVYAYSDDYNIYAITSTGSLKWKYFGVVWSFDPVLGPDGTLYVAGNSEPLCGRCAILAIDTTGSAN
jgi:outer membrane protein assembly factor BamB